MKIPINKKSTRNRGSLLIEVAAGFGALLVVSLLLLKAGVAVTTIQRWTVMQGLTDSFMSREVAMGKRLPFEGTNGFLEASSIYPDFSNSNAVATTTVNIGTMPGINGQAVTATLRRTRVPSTNNLVADGGSASAAQNPTGVVAWQLQSYLVYTISNRTYVKSRTVLRAR